MKNKTMFSQGEDLPLFSGTPITIHLAKPKTTTTSQPSFSTCRVCMDTGIVKDHDKEIFCLCPIGATLKLKRRTSKRLEKIRAHSPAAYAPDTHRNTLREVMGDRSTWTFLDALMVLIGEQAPSISATLLEHYPKPQALLNAKLAELQTIPGITLARAAKITAALHIAQLLTTQSDTSDPVITQPADAAMLLRKDMENLEYETMRILSLNTKNRVIDNHLVYQGSVNTTVIRVAELFKMAIRVNATAIIVAHNHPSGDPTPSPEDVAVTREITQSGKILDIDVLDHVVIGANGRFVSLKERGLGF